MPIVFLKSGGTVVCGGHTFKDGVAKLIDVKFEGTDVPEDKAKQPEAVVSLANVLYIIPGR
jgi:hypothetical protein